MARQLSVTVAFVSAPCYHVKPFLFFLKGIKETLAHYRGCDFSEHTHLRCLLLRRCDVSAVLKCEILLYV